jgi:hypothetical protein
MTCTLASSVIKSMDYTNGVLTLTFAKYTKRYDSVPTEVAYGLAYSKEPTKKFNETIKNKYKNEKIN